MRILQNFKISAPADTVWLALKDVAFVAECIPGATITEKIGDNRYNGVVEVSVGPIKAKFRGEVSISLEEESLKGTLAGKGIDGRTSSAAQAEMTYHIRPEGGLTHVDIVADVKLTGVLAQFGKSAVIKEISEQITRRFVDTFSERIAGRDGPVRVAAEGRSLGAGRLLMSALWTQLRAKIIGAYGYRKS